MIDSLKALIKYLLSFRKRRWELRDYPLRFRHQRDGEGVPWAVQIIHWWQMMGYGDTREQAYTRLEEHFAGYRASGTPLPRPGTKVALEFAASTQIEQYEDIAVEFFERLLNLNYSECFVSDESSLWDFEEDDAQDALGQRVADVYGIEMSEIEDGNLVRLFERIKETWKRSHH